MIYQNSNLLAVMSEPAASLDFFNRIAAYDSQFGQIRGWHLCSTSYVNRFSCLTAFTRLKKAGCTWLWSVFRNPFHDYGSQVVWTLSKLQAISLDVMDLSSLLSSFTSRLALAPLEASLWDFQLLASLLILQPQLCQRTVTASLLNHCHEGFLLWVVSSVSEN